MEGGENKDKMYGIPITGSLSRQSGVSSFHSARISPFLTREIFNPGVISVLLTTYMDKSSFSDGNSGHIEYRCGVAFSTGYLSKEAQHKGPIGGDIINMATGISKGDNFNNYEF